MSIRDRAENSLLRSVNSDARNCRGNPCLARLNLWTITSFIKEEKAALRSGKSSDPQNENKGRRRDRVSVNNYNCSLPKGPILLQYHLGTLASPLRT